VAIIRVVDDEGREVEAGEVGEMVVRGPHLMTGYSGEGRDSLWHYTNDLGIRHRDGSYDFVGPKLAMIKTGGENVYPAEVELALREHPAVSEGCVIGIDDPVWGQTLRAVIELKDGETASQADLDAFCRERLAGYKRPRSYVFIQSFPRNGPFVDRDQVSRLYGSQ
jgi:long-chain acyl-CoA synthetase